MEGNEWRGDVDGLFDGCGCVLELGYERSES